MIELRSPEQLNFSPLKRVAERHCSCRLRRRSIHTKPKKVKCKCTGSLNGSSSATRLVTFSKRATSR